MESCEVFPEVTVSSSGDLCTIKKPYNSEGPLDTALTGTRDIMVLTSLLNKHDFATLVCLTLPLKDTSITLSSQCKNKIKTNKTFQTISYADSVLQLEHTQVVAIHPFEYLYKEHTLLSSSC